MPSRSILPLLLLPMVLPLALPACGSTALERTEFTRGLRFRYRTPAEEHFFEVRSLQRHPRILRFEVLAFEDRNGDSVQQPDEPHVTYAQELARPSNVVLMQRAATGDSWRRTVYRARVVTERGVSQHTWVAENDAP